MHFQKKLREATKHGLTFLFFWKINYASCGLQTMPVNYFILQIILYNMADRKVAPGILRATWFCSTCLCGRVSITQKLLRWVYYFMKKNYGFFINSYYQSHMDVYLCVWMVHRMVVLCGRTSSSICWRNCYKKLFPANVKDYLSRIIGRDTN